MCIRSFMVRQIHLTAAAVVCFFAICLILYLCPPTHMRGTLLFFFAGMGLSVGGRQLLRFYLWLHDHQQT